MLTLQFTPEYSRRFPDPLNKTDEKLNIEHFLLLCEAKNLPLDIPTDPNPRAQRDIDKGIYKDVANSLIDPDDLSFHLKNKGITILADSVTYDETKKIFEVKFRPNQDGIVDGAHTYKVIKEKLAECPDRQFAKIEILTNVPDYLVDAIAEGLNTSVQVQQMSLSNHKKKFDWIKEEIRNESYFDKIAWVENQDGEFTVRHIISFLTLFNVELFPTDSSHPIIAYTSKEECLSRYLDNIESYKKLRPLLKEILALYDYIQLEGAEIYNKNLKAKGESGRGRKHAFYQGKKRGKYHFIFSNREAQHRLFDGALYPMFGAFRFLVKENPKDATFMWKLKRFEEVKKVFDKTVVDMIKSTKYVSDKYGRNPNAIGKDGQHWDNLFKTVKIAYLEEISEN